MGLLILHVLVFVHFACMYSRGSSSGININQIYAPFLLPITYCSIEWTQRYIGIDDDRLDGKSFTLALLTFSCGLNNTFSSLAKVLQFILARRDSRLNPKSGEVWEWQDTSMSCSQLNYVNFVFMCPACSGNNS